MSKNRELKDFLKESRLKAGLTQAQVSKKFGYTSPQFISNWERGVSNPPVDTLKVLTKMYAVEPMEAFNSLVFTETKALKDSLNSRFWGA